MESVRAGSPREEGGLTCWLALSPEQVEGLQGEKGASPDVYSGRFGLRKTPDEALARATEFMAWRPHGESIEVNPKSFKLCQVYFPASGYLYLTEKGRLETRKEGEWRLYGELKARETAVVNGKEVLLYEAGPEVHEIYP